MKKQFLIGAIALMGYVSPLTAQVKKSVELNISLNKIERTVDLLYELGTPELISETDSLGTIYRYEFKKPVYIDGEKFDKTVISYIDCIDTPDRIAITAVDKGFSTDIKLWYDGLYAPIDGVIDAGVSVSYGPSKAMSVYNNYKIKRLETFGDDLKKYTSLQQQQEYNNIIREFLKVHKDYKFPLQFIFAEELDMDN